MLIVHIIWSFQSFIGFIRKSCSVDLTQPFAIQTHQRQAHIQLTSTVFYDTWRVHYIKMTFMCEPKYYVRRAKWTSAWAHLAEMNVSRKFWNSFGMNQMKTDGTITRRKKKITRKQKLTKKSHTKSHKSIKTIFFPKNKTKSVGWFVFFFFHSYPLINSESVTVRDERCNWRLRSFFSHYFVITRLINYLRLCIKASALHWIITEATRRTLTFFLELRLE